MAQESLTMAKKKKSTKKTEKTASKNKVNQIIFEDENFEEQIHDPEAVLQMALIYERIEALQWRIKMQVRSCEDRMMQAKHEKQSLLTSFEAERVALNQRLKKTRKAIEEKYNIDLEQWGFDEELGILKKIPTDESESEQAASGNTTAVK
jgi:hypothetical protein